MLNNPQTTPKSNAVQEFIKSVLLETLTEREKIVASLRQKDVFGFDVKQPTLQQVGEQIGLSAERIRQMVAKIIRKIERRVFIINQSLK